MFTDGTSRRQTALQNLISSIFEDDVCRPLVLSLAILLEGEYSKQKCEAVIDMIKRRGIYLNQWDAVIQEVQSNYQHAIPQATPMNIGKLSDGGGLASDTCTSARKTRRLLADYIK